MLQRFFPYRFHPVHPCLEKYWGENGDELGRFGGNDDECDVLGYMHCIEDA